MIYVIMLLVLPTIISIIYAHFRADKRYLVGKESPATVKEMENINHKIFEFMNGIHSNMKDYSIKITVKDGKVSEVITGTDLTDRRTLLDPEKGYISESEQKAFSSKAAKILTFILAFVFTATFNSLILLLLEQCHII